MSRFAPYAVAAIAFVLVGAPTRGDDPPKHFSLLADTLEPTRCLLRTDSVVGYLAGDVETGCVLLIVPPLADFSDVRVPLVDAVPTDDETARPFGPGAPAGSFALSHNVTGKVSYHHEMLFPTATNRDLRTRRFSLFSADRNRDVIDLRLSWRVSSLSALDFGYQLQSNRESLLGTGEGYSSRRFASDADLDYAFTIGITRRFNSGR
jgi:hypothetical protein